MTLHIILKFSSTDPSDPTKNTIEEHRKVFEQHGAVWWGKFGKGMADERYDALNSLSDNHEPERDEISPPS
jgi:hypothetical protein